jgi:hypothetical protein
MISKLSTLWPSMVPTQRKKDEDGFYAART